MQHQWRSIAAGAFTLALAASAQAQVMVPGARVPRSGVQVQTGAWNNTRLTPDQRAELLVSAMTLDQKIMLVHGDRSDDPSGPSDSNGGAGFTQSVPSLGIPAIQMADAAVGVTRGNAMGRYSTPLPSAVSEASTWDAALACEYGGLIGQELRDQGYTMSLGGGVNLAREPRNGRIFEYKGEDPILAGKMVAADMKCLQAKGIIGDIKHFAVNDQETFRNMLNSILDKRTLRETDLLPFEIGIKEGDIQAVMCSYNKVNGEWACENKYLLNDFLKKAVGFKGFVLSDWGGTHSTAKAALAGLDMEQPGEQNFGAALKKAVQGGEVPESRLDDMCKRILRAQFATGQFDLRPAHRVPDIEAGLAVAQRVAERGSVLLKNADAQLPLNRESLKSIAVIGSHADVGVLSGGGSAQVNPPGGNAVQPPVPEWQEAPPPPGYLVSFPPPPPPQVPVGPRQGGRGGAGAGVYYPSSPLKAIQARAPNAKVRYNDGTNPAKAAALAKASDVAIVFVNQPASEGRDVSLTLPDNQDKLVESVVAANPRTIVVLETGGPVNMPWARKVPAILEAWYPGIRGAPAIANILFGIVNPSGKTVLSFAKNEADWPFDKPFASPLTGASPFDASYARQGLKVGYKWFDAEDKAPLFPFGHGLSYTTFEYSGLKTVPGHDSKVTFTVRNTGQRTGIEIAQVYVSLPASAKEPPKRLVAWQPVKLAPGQAKTVSLAVPALHISIFNEERDGWQIVTGNYRFMVGGSSRNLPLSATVKISE